MFEPDVTALHPPELLKPLTQRRELVPNNGGGIATTRGNVGGG
jgi:hypothetical protein